jgi:type III secretory pathway component EscR
MKRSLTLILAMFILFGMTQVVTAQVTPQKEADKMEKKEMKKKSEKMDKAGKKTKKEALKKKAAGNEKQQLQQAAPKSDDQPAPQKAANAEEVKPRKNEPRPYVSQPIEKPAKKEPPQEPRRLATPEDQAPK